MSVVAAIQIGPVAVVAAVAIAWESISATVVVAVVQIVVEVRVCFRSSFCLGIRSSFCLSRPLANVVVVVTVVAVGDSIGMAVDGGGGPVDCGGPVVDEVAVGAVAGNESIVVERKVGISISISFSLGISLSIG